MALTIIRKADLVDERYLNACDTPEVRAVMAECARQRSYHRAYREGYSQDRELRKIGDVPPAIYNHPAFRHIFHNHDAEQGARNRREFLKIYSKFMCVDRM